MLATKGWIVDGWMEYVLMCYIPILYPLFVSGIFFYLFKKWQCTTLIHLKLLRNVWKCCHHDESACNHNPNARRLKNRSSSCHLTSELRSAKTGDSCHKRLPTENFTTSISTYREKPPSIAAIKGWHEWRNQTIGHTFLLKQQNKLTPPKKRWGFIIHPKKLNFPSKL